MHPTIYIIPVRLTRQKKDILLLLSHGHTYQEIGQQLFLSPRTIENHVYHLKKTLNCKSNTHLIAEAFRLKIIE